ncbi:hypothetical protein PHLCEN_2v7635 [Hermanssonia centrifuga]|uniref:Uncharacterized protein n=1 Tax=Hermanssonia centrifuga TaxID=98765 RepID=A0A2R6NVX4_9APHY|nr:hypothetical protein PHLCEN_2v7635 [Hermanssonia centrifuga]
MSTKINYAVFDGIHRSELPAAIIFTVIYVPPLLISILLAFRKKTSVYRSLVLFSLSKSGYMTVVFAGSNLLLLARLVSFALRSALAGNTSAAENESVLIAEQVIYSVGFAGLIYSAYTLIIDRDEMMNPGDTGGRTGIFLLLGRVLKYRNVMRLTITVAIILGICGGVKAGDTDPSQRTAGSALRETALYIFLVVVCVLNALTLLLAADERRVGVWEWDHVAFGERYGILILLVIALMCLTREAYLVSTTSNLATVGILPPLNVFQLLIRPYLCLQQNNAAAFYPLAALPEFIAVMMFMVPGLVPSKIELLERANSSKSGRVTDSGISMTQDPRYTPNRV